jgi:hypothetical protein
LILANIDKKYLEKIEQAFESHTKRKLLPAYSLSILLLSSEIKKYGMSKLAALAFYGLLFQPYILVVGDSKKQFFVRIEHRMLVASSLLDALDSTSKFFYVLCIHYPFLGIPIWQFVQQLFFEKLSLEDSKISRITSLI